MRTKDLVNLEEAFNKVYLKEEESAPMELSLKSEYDIDNRDITTTELVLRDGKRIEVNPWDLVENALENAGYDDLIPALQSLLAKVRD